MSTSPIFFDTVLVANRGEIAARVIRGCKALGYRTVAVYSDADRDAPHVALADAAVPIGAAPARESYLDIGKLVAAAQASGAQAVHPGYGFLSERADFARTVQEAGLVFIGPDPASIDAMGNKSQARRRMLAAGVPCVPGWQGDDADDATLAREALRVGLPVMIKAAAGGGGRGMRLVRDADDLPAAIASARSEAANAFGDGQLLVEKAVLDARHVEVQVFGDRHGNVVHLGERDCSVQRRNQKVIEEAPSPAVDEALRARMGEAAVAAARAVDYVGAGTVEFMLAPDGAFYFLEMNTRLQVEHPVTELVYGVDLVEWQLRVARGEPLPLTQEAITARRRGWAIEVRLCAEAPADDFRPQTGEVLAWRAPAGEGMRVDHGLREGGEVGPHYDSLLAKLIAFGATREEARRRLARMLAETVLLGVANNRDFLARAVGHPAFAAGTFSTGFIAEHFPSAALREIAVPDVRHRALAAALFAWTDAARLRDDAGFDANLRGWSNSEAMFTPLALRCGDMAFAARLRAGSVELLSADGSSEAVPLHVEALDGIDVRYRHEGADGRARCVRDGTVLWLDADGIACRCEDVTYAPARRADAAGSGQVTAPMSGRIVAVPAQPGATVRKGETLVVLEAMKMEFRLDAGIDGTVARVDCAVGQQVSARQVLAVVA